MQNLGLKSLWMLVNGSFLILASVLTGIAPTATASALKAPERVIHIPGGAHGKIGRASWRERV